MQSKNQQDTKPRMLMFITFKSINSMCHIMEISSDEWEGRKKVKKRTPSYCSKTSTEPQERQALVFELDAVDFLRNRTPAFHPLLQLHSRSPREDLVDHTRVTAKGKTPRGKGTPQEALPREDLCIIFTVKCTPLLLHNRSSLVKVADSWDHYI